MNVQKYFDFRDSAMPFFTVRWKIIAEGRAASLPSPLQLSSLPTGDFVIARTLPEAISNCKNVILNYSQPVIDGLTGQT